MNLPTVVSRHEWVAARKALLVKEKELTRRRDEISAERRRLPMVRVEKGYRLRGPEGELGLLDLFDGGRQLIVHHFMFAPDWDDGCATCTAFVDEIAEGTLDHLNARGTNLVLVSRAPIAKLARYQRRRGWSIPWYSSFGSDFNHDFHVTLDSTVRPVEYNYRGPDEHESAGSGHYTNGRQPIEQHGHSCFLREGDTVFHTYSMYARGCETVGGSYYYLDLTALGRQEDWELPAGRAHDPGVASPDFAV